MSAGTKVGTAAVTSRRSRHRRLELITITALAATVAALSVLLALSGTDTGNGVLSYVTSFTGTVQSIQGDKSGLCMSQPNTDLPRCGVFYGVNSPEVGDVYNVTVLKVKTAGETSGWIERLVLTPLSGVAP